jgi:hypothetical protein
MKEYLKEHLRRKLFENILNETRNNTPPNLGPGLVRLGPDDEIQEYEEDHPDQSNPLYHPASPYYQPFGYPILNPFPGDTRPNWFPAPFAPNLLDQEKYRIPGHSHYPINWPDILAWWAQKYYEKYGRWPEGFNGPNSIPGTK